MTITRRDYALLKWAIAKAEEWRGSFTGNPDERPLKDFELKLAGAKEVLKQISPYTPDWRIKNK